MKNNSFHYYSIIIIFLLFISSQCFAQKFERSELAAGLANIDETNGIAVADYDGDLDLDIFVVVQNKATPGEQKNQSKLFRNDNNGNFTDVTEEAGLLNLLTINEPGDTNPALEGFKYAVSWGDYDNDGYPDLFFTHFYKVQLFHNEGDGTFVEKTIEAGISQTNTCWNTGATWFDFNNDGFLDIYISDWGNCEYNSFYLNNGDGTFKNVSNQFQLADPNIRSYMSVPFDFNNDGWMDLYISNDHFYKNEVYINNNGVTFTEKSSDYGIGNEGNDMGISVSDFNNDGSFDFFITNIKHNVLFRNKGDNTYDEIASNHKIDDTGWGWDNVFADFDLDGDEDLFIVNGFRLTPQEKNTYFENLLESGSESFQDSSEEVNLDDYTRSVGATPFDYDNDGDLDLFISNSDGPSFFYQNPTTRENPDLNWFKVSLEGTTSNKNAVGTSLSITTNLGTIHRYYTGLGFLSQSIQPVHFGLNSASEILELKIKWPSGLVETHQNIDINSFIKATEGQGIEVLNISPSEKITGCTDPNSCNYNPLATENDGSCSYFTPGEITGSTNSSYNKSNSYSYQAQENNTISWSVEGGEIISGQGTTTIQVKWGFHDSGKITVLETSAECTSNLAELNVQLDIINTEIEYSIARIWNEALLEAIRHDFARPNVHARNLFHTSIALYDIWAIFDETASPYLIGNDVHGFTSSLKEFTPNEAKESAMHKAMSYAAYNLLSYRFKDSPGAESSLKRFQFIMEQYGYDTAITTTNYDDGNAAGLGNFVAETIINYGKTDGSNEANDYGNKFYEPINPPLNLGVSGEETGIIDPNRWQPLTFSTFIDQSGNLIIGSTPEFLGPEWGNVKPFAMPQDAMSIFQRNNNTYNVYHDPGAPPYLNLANAESNKMYQWNFSLVSIWSSHLDPSDPTMWDISPNTIGNIDISDFPKSFEEHPLFYNEFDGGDISKGHSINPSTGQPYETQLVLRADYTRVLAEFWADGPDSETPPGHWFTILNYVNDNPQFERKFNGTGEQLSPLEWDIKAYFILGGAMHDAAISAWGVKGWYDYIRPISAIRYMCELGQSSNENLENYHPAGIPLVEGYVEIVEENDPLSGNNNEHVGKIKLLAWKGHDYIQNATTDIAGVDWILGENWWPYQRPSFVTPPFAGYVSGHSTYSRAAAEVMTMITGDEFFPGGMGEFIAKKNEFLAFEKGPSSDVILQWATYRDASDQTSLSRIWGGIHPPADDIPGRFIGEKVGIDTYNFAIPYFNGTNKAETSDLPNFVIYPNPVENNYIQVLNTTKETTFSLFDMLGKPVTIIEKSFDSNNKTELQIPPNLSSGIYFLKINKRVKMLLIRQ